MEEEFVFVFEVEIYCCSAVFDEVSNLSHGQLLETLFLNDFQGGVQNQFPDFQLLFLFSFGNTHGIKFSTKILNTVNFPNFIWAISGFGRVLNRTNGKIFVANYLMLKRVFSTCICLLKFYRKHKKPNYLLGVNAI